MNALERAQRCAEVMYENDASSRALGITIDVPEAGVAVATMTVREDMLNGFAVCHGGLLFTLADTAFAFACNAWNDETLSIEASVNWQKTAHADDRLTAVARKQRREGRHGYYDVDVHNQRGEQILSFSGHSIARGRPLFAEDKGASRTQNDT